MQVQRRTRKFTTTLFTGLSLAALISLSACGQMKEAALPDDPESEAVPANPQPSTPVADNNDDQAPLGQDDRVLQKYDYLDPNHEIDTGLLAKAVQYFDANQSKFANKNYIGVIDFAKKSTLKRFFIIDMKTGAVWGMHVAHGKGSDSDHDGFAEKFSNVEGSNASSLGVYRGAETYSGNHGLSMRLDGLSSTNSNARERAVVIHGADYVQESSVLQGRSWGCPAVTMDNRDEVVRRLKNGSMIYAGLSGQ